MLGLRALELFSMVKNTCYIHVFNFPRQTPRLNDVIDAILCKTGR
jgi:hypothetical protein